MVHELFFEIVREKQHVFCDAKDTAPVLELKRIVEGVLKIPVTDQVLVRLLDDSTTNFQPLDDKKTLAESGFTVNNAKEFASRMKAKKRKLAQSDVCDENEPVVKSPQTEAVEDTFTKRFEFSLSNEVCEQLRSPKSKRSQRNYDLPSLGAVVEYAGALEQPSLDENPISASKTGWNEGIIRNFENEPGDQHEADFLNIITRYMDLYTQPTPNCYSYRTVYLAHALNHVIRTRNLVISNNRKLELAASKGLPNDDLVESTRDQGFVRPTILILCPFKKDAFDIVQRLERLVYGGEGKGSVWNRDRFNTEFKSEDPPEFKTRMPEEFKELMTGNNDDCFRVGIALSK
ncbi:hypothetical protein ANCCAN_17247, partial [Ancylostoma caninum]